MPFVNISWTTQTGDTLEIVEVTTVAVKFGIRNGGAYVARSATVVVQGYWIRSHHHQDFCKEQAMSTPKASDVFRDNDIDGNGVVTPHDPDFTFDCFRRCNIFAGNKLG